MARTLQEISDDIKSRLTSDEYLPLFVERSDDLNCFAESVGDFMAVHIRNLELLEDIWDDEDTLKYFLTRKKMFLSGGENLAELQIIMADRLKIISKRGTLNMLEEVQRICNENTNTNITLKSSDEIGWVCGKSSPCYTETSTSYNYCYVGLKEAVVFELDNQTNHLTDDDIKNILKKYFEPKNIRTFYEFI